MKKIAIMSGKGGVGKSVVTAVLGYMLSKNNKVGILDADITGPSIPLLFGLEEKKIEVSEFKINPLVKEGVKIMSIGFLLPEKDSAVIWRGPLISKAFQQMMEEVNWGNLDYLLIDMPPGTGDAPLTAMQLGVDGVIIVMTPQEIVISDVKRAINFTKQMDVPIFGIVENMSFIDCPECHNKIKIFGPSQVGRIAEENNIKKTAKVALDANISSFADRGEISKLASLNVFTSMKNLFK